MESTSNFIAVLNSAVQLVIEGKVIEAAECFLRLYIISNNFKHLISAYSCYKVVKDNEKCIIVLHDIISLMPTDEGLFTFELATCYELTGQYQLALSYFSRASILFKDINHIKVLDCLIKIAEINLLYCHDFVSASLSYSEIIKFLIKHRVDNYLCNRYISILILCRIVILGNRESIVLNRMDEYTYSGFKNSDKYFLVNGIVHAITSKNISQFDSEIENFTSKNREYEILFNEIRKTFFE